MCFPAGFFEDPYIASACKGNHGIWCTHLKIDCGTKIILIFKILLRSNSDIGCAVGLSNCLSHAKCCSSDNYTEHTLNGNSSYVDLELELYKKCSGKKKCDVPFPNVQHGSVIPIQIVLKYHCIEGKIILLILVIRLLYYENTMDYNFRICCAYRSTFPCYH